MGHAQLSNLKALHKLETIEKEVRELKLSILKKFAPTGKKTTSFRGILKGVDITDADVSAAKKSLYGKTRA
jgi:hypothetical protein